MPQINYDIWLESYPAYTGLNTRTGTAAITDADYNNFAPFSLAYYSTGANKYTLWNWLNGGELSLDNEIDKSMCYVGMYNDELPQLNIAAYAFDTYDTIDNPLYKTDNTQIQSYFCIDTWNFMFQQTQIPNGSRLYGDGRIYDKDFTYISNKMQIYKDGTIGAQPHISPPTTTNLHDWLNIYLSFGVKSLILEINVAYKTGNGTFYPDQARCTLAAYIANTTEWKQSHPILQAYCIPYIRGNANGTYSNTGRTFETYNCIQTFSPAFTLPYLSQNSDYPDIITYTTTMSDGQGTRNGYFPLFGTMVGELAISSTATAIQNMGVLVPLMGINRGTLGKRQSSGYMYYWLELDGSDDDNIEWLRRAAAAYGLFFCDSIGTLGNSGRDLDRWIDSNMCLGTIDEDGRTNGDYTRGLQNMLQRQFEWTDSTESPFDPGALPPDVDPNHYSDSTSLPSLPWAAENVWTDVTLGSLTPKMQIGNILDLISSTAETAFADVTDAVTAIAYQKYNKDFLYQEPIKTIIDYRRILLSQPWTRAATAEPIVLGRFYSTDAEKPFTGYKNPNTFRRVDIGSVKLWRTFGNFLDFEPYSQAFLYVPYCGIKQLPMDIFGGHTINIKLNANNITGELDALIFVDNIEWGSMHGEASEELPLMAETSMTNAATQRQLNYQAKQTEFSQTIGMFGSLAGASISAAMANPLGVIIQAGTAGVKKMQESAIQKELEYQIKHTKPEILAIQSGSASIEQANCLVPFIMLQSPVIIGADTPEQQKEVARVYGKTKGFKCCEVGPLGNFSGLTKCSNAILDNISCTLTEKKMILEALQEGVILDWE